MRALREYIRTGDGVLALTLVLAGGLALTFFTWRTFVDPPPRQYSVDFGAARWVDHEGVAPCTYFRKTLYISGNVDRAWMEVSGTDRFFIYVNGILAEKGLFAAARPTVILDLKCLLRPGKNVIAIYIPRNYYPGNARLLVRGVYATQTASLTEFYSDASWKVSTTPDGIVGGLEWFQPMLDDSRWANARETSSGEVFSTVQRVEINPKIFEIRPAAVWLGPRTGGVLDATFESVEVLPLIRGATWLQVAATGSYDVIINRRLAISEPQPQQTKLPFSRTPTDPAFTTAQPSPSPTATPPSPAATTAKQLLSATAPASVPTLVAYDVSRFTRAGTNTISVHARSEVGAPAVLVAGGTEVGAGAIKTFASNAAWQVREPFVGALATGPAAVLGPYGMQPWGVLPQVPEDPQLLSVWDSNALSQGLLILVVIEIFIIALWLTAASWLRRKGSYSYEQSLTAAALLHLPTFAAFMLAWLLSFDVRLPDNWCFKPAVVFGGFALLLVSQLLLLSRGRSQPTVPALSGRGDFRWKIAAFAAVTLLGFFLRWHNFNAVSLSSDEVGMIRNVDGVMSDGYPHKQRGSMDKLLSTYELIPYTLAASVSLFGRTDLGYHLPSLLFSTLTIGLIGFVGTRMKDWRVGLTSALIYACFPGSIAWANDAFYPSQEQFLSLLTFWLFYEAISGPELRPHYLTFASITLVLAYFSWEGSGFNLPALFIAMVVMRWGDFRWIKDWHLWRCLVVVGCLIVAQLAYRQLTFASFPTVGFSISDVTTPSLAFRSILTYDATYYLRVLFFSEVNFVPSLFIFGGFLFCWRDRPTRYLIVMLFALILLYTNLLPVHAPRYCYNAEVLIILAGVAIFFAMRDRIAALGASILPRWPRMIAWGGAAALTAIFLLAANELVVKSYRLSAVPLNPIQFARIGYYKTDYRGTALFVAKFAKPGDGIVTFNPSVFELYSGKYSNYALNTLLNGKMTYDPGGEHPTYLDKFLGRPLIRNVDEFRDVLTRFNRLWVVTPVRAEATILTPEMSSFLYEHGRVVFESYRQNVVLIEGSQGPTSRREVVN